MNKSKIISFTAILALCPPVICFAASGRYAVMPFAALSGDVPAKSGSKAATMLANELKNVEGVEVVEPKKSSSDATADGLAKARTWVEEAKTLRTQRQFAQAESTLRKALTEYEARAAEVSDVGEVADVHALLAAVLRVTGRDEEALQSLRTAMTLSWGRELPLAKTSASLTRHAQQVRATLQSGPKGVVVLQSVPSGAPVWLDGLPVGKTPLSVREVPVGTHHYRASLPGTDASGGWVQVDATKSALVTIEGQGAEPDAKLAALLARNQLDETALKVVQAYGQTASATDVVFGALAVDSGQLVLWGFALQTGTGQVRRLPKASFDTELLSAGVELLRLAAQVPQPAPPLRLPAPVSTTPLATRERPTEVKYAATAGHGQGQSTSSAQEPSNSPRTPLGTERRKPLTRP